MEDVVDSLREIHEAQRKAHEAILDELFRFAGLPVIPLRRRHRASAGQRSRRRGRRPPRGRVRRRQAPN